MSISSNSKSEIDLLTSIDPHKLDILDKRIRGDGEGGIESAFSSPPPRSIISPGTVGGGIISSGGRRGSGSSRPRGNSLCNGDNVSNMTATTWVGSDANNDNDGDSSNSGECDGASSRSSCQTVHHANLMRDGVPGGLTATDSGIGKGGIASSVTESGPIQQQLLLHPPNSNSKKKSTPSKRPVSAIGDRMQQVSPPLRPKNSVGGNGAHHMKNETKSRTTTSTIAVTEEVSSMKGASQLNGATAKQLQHVPTPPYATDATSSAVSTSSGPPHTTTAASGPETSRSESRDSTLYSYFGTSASALSSSNHAATTTSNPPMIRLQQHHLSPPILHSKQPKMGNQRTLHSFLGISDKKQQQQQQSAEQEANNEGGIGELGGVGASTSAASSKSVTASSSSISSSSSSKKMKGSSSHKVVSSTSDTSTTTMHDSAEQQQQQSLVREIKRLHAQLSTLQKQLEEANARNNSIKNNQTLISANLQRQLKFVKAELEEVKRESHVRQLKAMETMEKFVREESMREAKELRQSLASDGARLGKLLSSRVSSHHGGGMMGGLVRSSQSIETWEDGHAPKMIKVRRGELKVEKERLEKRMEELVCASQNGGHHGPELGSESSAVVPSVQDGDSTLLVANELSDTNSSGTAIMSDLDRMEAMETIKMHLHEVKKKEMELDAEERALNIEKRAHVRALKLVSNEDSSKFRSRRKLHDRYVLMNLLGKGGFSEVWRAFDLQNVKHVAVKIHQLESSWSDAKKENYTKHVSREYEIHREVRHPRIVSLYDVFEIDTDSFATVLECCKGTDLDTLLKDRGRLPERDARAILLQILIGMRYLSTPSADGRRQGIIHYDLKPGNILFDEQGNAKITDFGLSKIVDAAEEGDSMELTSQGAGTYWYLPPECFLMDQDVRISNKVDVWSIGVIYFQMLFGRRPFGDGQTQDHILRNQTMLHATEVHFPTNPSITEEGKSFIRDCLTYDQTIRPNICQLCEHSYMKYTFRIG